ncbi:MAG: ATP-binding protein [Nitrospinae bacterium]|nr:ATP-binding protein [Nitrospinota bacterium]
MFKRTLSLINLLKRKSFFLFGPRGTGKTTLIASDLQNVTVINLLENKVYREYLKNPSLLSEQTLRSIVVIDEVQKLPELLDEVHHLIETQKITFLLTGSSARKLKRGGVNLLAGRAWWAELFPLTSQEIKDFDLLTYLNRGGLPAIYLSDDYEEELRAYTALYLREEVLHEAVTRNIARFSEFMELLALTNGQEISYQNLASDCGVSGNTIKSYFEVLEDTLLTFNLRAFTKTKKRKAISRSKFYFFDIGVTASLTGRGHVVFDSELFGKAFEHFIVLELRAYISYSRSNKILYYWRSTSQYEVDVIVDDLWGFEIKGAKQVNDRHLKGLRALKEEGLIQNFAIISRDFTERTTKDDIKIIPWQSFLKKLWAGGFF